MEPRVVLNAPMDVPGSPLPLPTEGEWVSTPFVGSPVMADLDGDGDDEVITAVAGSRLVAYRSVDGGGIAPFQTYDAPSSRNFKATPIVVERPGQSPMIVAALGRDESRDGDGDDRVYAFDAVTGQVVPGWPASTGRNFVGKTGTYGPLASGDLDGDGVPEIVVTSFSHFVTAYRIDGSVLWRFANDDTIHSGAVIGDLDRDGRPEVVVGGDSSESDPSGTNPGGDFFDAGGFLNILDSNGSAKYRIRVGESIWSSPSLADLDGDGTLEIVVGTGLAFGVATPSPAVRASGNQILAFDFEGELLPGWPYRTTTDDSQDRQVYSSPAVADLDGDGTQEVVAVDRQGFAHVVRFDGSAFPGFEGGRTLVPPGSMATDVFGSPVIADTDGDGTPEILGSVRESLTALDLSGNRRFTIVVPGADSRFNAPAIGQFDGSGGLELAAVSNTPTPPNPPTQLGIYALPESTLEPPWPMHRRSADGVAIAQNERFLEPFVRAAYRSLLERTPTPEEGAIGVARLAGNEVSLARFTRELAGTPESRSAVVQRLYQRFLERAPTPEELSGGAARLATPNVAAKDLARDLVVSAEFAAATDGTDAGLVTRMFRKILRRDPSPVEAGAYTSLLTDRIVPPVAIADALLVSEEFIFLDVVAPVLVAYQAEFGGATPFSESDAAAVLFDRTGARQETEIRAGLVSSGGNYARTSLAAGYVRSAYRDVLAREGDAGEVAAWLRAFAEGSSGIPEFARSLLLSPEGRAEYVRRQARELLDREADPALIQAFADFGRREDVTIALVGSGEYFDKNGGTNRSFVESAFRDLAGFDPMPSQATQAWVDRIESGTPRSQLPTDLLATREGVEFRVVERLFRYIPDEAQGVLRTGNNDIFSGVATNPDPSLLASLVDARLDGQSETEMLVGLLTSPTYLSKSDWFRGFYRSRGIRR